MTNPQRKASKSSNGYKKFATDEQIHHPPQVTKKKKWNPLVFGGHTHYDGAVQSTRRRTDIRTVKPPRLRRPRRWSGPQVRQSFQPSVPAPAKPVF